MSQKSIIDIIKDNSLNIYDALNEKTISIDKIYKIIKNNKSNELTKIPKSKNNKLLNKYTKKEMLNKLLILFDNRFNHLKSIKDIVDIDELLNYAFSEPVFIEKTKIHYTNLILDLILEKYYDYSDIKLLSNKKEEVLDLEKNINSIIIRKIHEFYIKRITN